MAAARAHAVIYVPELGAVDDASAWGAEHTHGCQIGAGPRGFSPFIVRSRAQLPFADLLPKMADNLSYCLWAETCDAVDTIEDICAVPGVELIIPAKFDLSDDLSVPGQLDAPEFGTAGEKIEAAATVMGHPLGNAVLD